MRRSATEIVRNLESRIARLENKTSAKKYTISNDKATIMCNVNWQYNQTGRILISHLDKSLVKVASTKVMNILKKYDVVDVHTMIPHNEGVSMLIEFSLLLKTVKGLPEAFRDTATKDELTNLMDELMSLPNVILM